MRSFRALGEREMAMRAMVTLGLSLMLAAPATAEAPRDLCADRPGLGTPACTVDKGHVQVEIGLADWTLDRQPDVRTDTILASDLQLRYGVSDTTELRLGWTAYGHQRERDRANGAIDRTARTGDVTLGIKQNLRNPDGSKLSVALLPFVSVPVGRRPIGQGDWGAGLLVPVDYEVAEGVTLQLTSEIDAAVDEDGAGRHLAYGSVAGIEFDLTETFSIDAELEATRDRDPGGHATMTLAALSFAYKPQKQIQFDIGGAAGLNHATPDVEVYFGVSRKF